MSVPDVRTASVAWASRITWRNRESDWGQLIFAFRGTLTVSTDVALWVVPPHQAVWVPRGVRHSVELAGGVALRLLYIRHAPRRAVPARCQAVEVSPLLRELLRRTLELGTLDRRVMGERHVLDLLLDQLAVLPVAPVDLPSPRDARAQRAATYVHAHPDARHATAKIERAAGASRRTLERLFRAETGLSFGVWCQRARLVRALQLLAEGMSVSQVALQVGYSGSSAFVAAFRASIGTTPGHHYRRLTGAVEVRD